MVDINLIGSYAILPVVLGCYLVGFVIKNYITKLPKRFIPLITLFVGMVINVIISIQNKTPIDVMTFISGGISGLAASGSYELITKTLGLKALGTVEKKEKTEETNEESVAEEEPKEENNEDE